MFLDYQVASYIYYSYLYCSWKIIRKSSYWVLNDNHLMFYRFDGHPHSYNSSISRGYGQDQSSSSGRDYELTLPNIFTGGGGGCTQLNSVVC